MRQKFESLRDSQHCYAYDTSQFNSCEVSPRLRMMATYGDGLTQHSPDWAITRESAVDYFESLAAFLVTPEADGKILDSVAYLLDQTPDEALIEFAASVVWKESDDDYRKRRYYSIDERKISSSDAKRYDKRYEEITKYMDGTPATVFGMVCPKYAEGIQAYQYAEAVRDWFSKQTEKKYKHTWMEPAGIFLKWYIGQDSYQNHSNIRRLNAALDACRAVCKAHRLRNYAAQYVENMREAIAIERAKLATMEPETLMLEAAQ